MSDQIEGSASLQGSQLRMSFDEAMRKLAAALGAKPEEIPDAVEDLKTRQGSHLRDMYQLVSSEKVFPNRPSASRFAQSIAGFADTLQGRPERLGLAYWAYLMNAANLPDGSPEKVRVTLKRDYAELAERLDGFLMSPEEDAYLIGVSKELAEQARNVTKSLGNIVFGLHHMGKLPLFEALYDLIQNPKTAFFGAQMLMEIKWDKIGMPQLSPRLIRFMNSAKVKSPKGSGGSSGPSSSTPAQGSGASNPPAAPSSQSSAPAEIAGYVDAADLMRDQSREISGFMDGVPETAVVAAHNVSDLTFIGQLPIGALNYSAVQGMWMPVYTGAAMAPYVTVNAGLGCSAGLY